VRIDHIERDPGNPRVHSDKQIRQIAASITEFGFTVPLLLDAQRRIIAGHGRLEAAKLIAMREVPTISLTHLTPLQSRALMIADNKLSANADWDENLLAQQFATLSEADLNFDLEITGFETAEIDMFVEGLNMPEDDADRADQLPAEHDQSPVSVPGDVWRLNEHLVSCANALDLRAYARLMGRRKAAAIFTDPPFNLRINGHVGGLGKIRHREFAQASGEMSEAEFADFLERALGNGAKFSRDGAIHFVAMDWRHLSELLAAGRKVFTEVKNLCVWTKNNGGMGSFYRSQHELFLVFKSGNGPHRNNFELGQYGRYRTNVWQYPGATSFSRSGEEGNLLALHPTVKPVRLVADAILDVTKRGDIVLDQFLGSGTTVIAAEKTGRVCYGLEIDPLYVDTVVRRWQTFSGKTAIHNDSGRAFPAVETERANG